MQNTSFDTTSPLTHVAETPAAQAAEQEHDPASGITLSGRNRVCARARALAGMVMTSGLVVAISATDTTSSMHHNLIH